MPWTWSLNWGEVTPRLVVGTCPMGPDDLDRIRRGTGATAVLSLQHDDCLAYWGIDPGALRARAGALGLVLARCPIRDFDVADMRRRLPQAVSALAALVWAGHRCYVHCTAGMGRSPLVVLGYLVLVEGRDPEQAISAILAGRPEAVPAWEAYHGARADLVARHRAAIERRAYRLYREGVYASAEADWRQAEGEVLRAALLGARAGSRDRPPGSSGPAGR